MAGWNDITLTFVSRHSGWYATRGVGVRWYELRHQQQEAKAYFRLLRHLLTEEVQRSFNEEHPPLTPRISDLMRQLEDAPKDKKTK